MKYMDKLRDQIKGIFDNAPFAVCAFDASGTVFYINPLLESNIDTGIRKSFPLGYKYNGV